jgi:hypothetical protein
MKYIYIPHPHPYKNRITRTQILTNAYGIKIVIKVFYISQKKKQLKYPWRGEWSHKF